MAREALLSLLNNLKGISKGAHHSPAPAAKALSPAPVTMMAPIEVSASIERAESTSSRTYEEHEVDCMTSAVSTYA
eukprot:scaffold238666_cov31-Tisochrysis_lutea.AAC.1